MSQRTFVMVKPDGVRRGLTGEIISRLERKSLRLVAARLFTIDKALAEKHYGEHVGKPFFGELVSFITSGPVMAMCVEGDEAVSVCRTLMGVTDPKKAAPGTIRGDLGLIITENLVHGSDSPESAARELGLFFPDLNV
ncbi:MAG: nucleoside-diphosphate kinase [Actinomycetota bacterium]